MAFVFFVPHIRYINSDVIQDPKFQRMEDDWCLLCPELMVLSGRVLEIPR